MSKYKYLFLLNILLTGWALPAAAQQFPTKSIRFLVGFAPGGSTDIVARIIAQEMSKTIGQQVVVDNRPGAGGNIAAEAATKAPPDGHTIFACTTGVFAIQPFLYSKLPYDPEKGFAHITQTGSLPYIVVTHPSLPAKNIREFIAVAKARPGEINYASSGIGTASHLSAAYFASVAGLKLVHVPYKGSGQIMGDLIGGQVVMLFDQPVSSMPHVKAGKLRALAVTSAQRSPSALDVPTMSEAGLDGFDVQSWYGLMAPKGTPRDIIARLNTESVKALGTADIKERFMDLGAVPGPMSSEAFGEFIRAEITRWAEVVKASGAKVE